MIQQLVGAEVAMTLNAGSRVQIRKAGSARP
jgi:hypothetical protein